jgi:DinB superfamily
VNLKTYIVFQLKEIRQELLEVLTDLDDKTLKMYSLSGHWPIAWHLQHCCFNIDKWLYSNITGSYLLEHNEIFNIWPPVKPDEDFIYYSNSEIRENIISLFNNILKLIENFIDNDFCKMYNKKEELSVSCLRVINHSNLHLRNIWCIIGEVNLNKWSEQKSWTPKDL